jgi:hypothetical protein
MATTPPGETTTLLHFYLKQLRENQDWQTNRLCHEINELGTAIHTDLMHLDTTLSNGVRDLLEALNRLTPPPGAQPQIVPPEDP